MTSALQPLSVAPVPRLALRRAEMAEAIGVSDRTLWEWTRAGVVPHLRVGGVVLYPVDAIREWLVERSRVENMEAG